MVEVARQIDEGGFDDAGQIAADAGARPLRRAQQNGALRLRQRLAARLAQERGAVHGRRRADVATASTTTTTAARHAPREPSIERIEVLKGGQGLYYGTQAVGGVDQHHHPGGFTHRVRRRSSRPALDSDDGYPRSTATSRRRGRQLSVHSSSDATTRRKASSLSATRTTSRAATDRRARLPDRHRLRRQAIAWRTMSVHVLRHASYQHNGCQSSIIAAPEDRRGVGSTTRDEDSGLGQARLDAGLERFGLLRQGLLARLGFRISPTSTTMLGPESTGELDHHRRSRPSWVFEDYGINVLSEYPRSATRSTIVGGLRLPEVQRHATTMFLIGEQSKTVNAAFAQISFDLEVLDGAQPRRRRAPQHAVGRPGQDGVGPLGPARASSSRCICAARSGPRSACPPPTSST